jgi:hypothetical protein
VIRHCLFDWEGRHLADLNVTKATWTQTIGAPDQLKFDVPAWTSAMSKLDLDNLVTSVKTVIAVVDDGIFRAAGIVGDPDFDDDNGILQLSGIGWESMMQSRFVLPEPMGDLIGPDGKPVTTYDTNLSGWEYGTLIKKLIVQGRQHPAWRPPWVFEADRVGTREKFWAAADLKNLGEAVEDISNLEGGPEYDFVSRWDGAFGIEAFVRTGTDDDPELSSQLEYAFGIRGKNPSARKLKQKLVSSYLTSRVYMTGGKSDDRMLVSRADDETLLDLKFPFRETVDTSHSTVSEQPTLDSWATRRLAQGQRLGKFWTFEVRKDLAHQMRKGDWCTLQVRGSYMIPDGIYRRRVVALSGDVASRWFTVTTAEA